MSITKETMAEAQAKLEAARGGRGGKEKSREALAFVGSMLEEAMIFGSGYVDELRGELGLGRMEDMPWDGVAELVGWEG